MPTIQEIIQTLLSASLATLKMTYGLLLLLTPMYKLSIYYDGFSLFIYGKLIDILSSLRSYLLCKVVWG